MLERINETGAIFFARSDEPWVLSGAAVHISFVGQDGGGERDRTLDGQPVAEINADLTSGIDVTKARPLRENLGIAFMGVITVGPFDISHPVASEMLVAPNPHRRPNTDVLRPWMNGRDLTSRSRNRWVIDFGDRSERDAALYETPFAYALEHVKPMREHSSIAHAPWWQHWRPRPEMTVAIDGLHRYIATPLTSKHRVFVWVDGAVVLDHAAAAFARDDDYTFGVLHSRVHELWALAQGTQLETRPRYTPTTTFETFPFPRPTDTQREAIADAARDLDRLRTGWLNPPGLSDADLAKRTLTNLYNARPTWLAQAHERLDVAVLAAYGWFADIDREDLLARLLVLNLARAAEEATGD